MQHRINKIILQRQRQLVSNHPESWGRCGNYCWENQITCILPLSQFFYALVWVIGKKASQTISSVTRSLETDHLPTLKQNFGYLALWLTTNSSISREKKVRAKFHPLLTSPEIVCIVHFRSCVLCRLWYLEGCVQCTKLPWALELNELSWSSLDMGSFYNPICLHDEIGRVLVRGGTKNSTFSEVRQLSLIWPV